MYINIKAIVDSNQADELFDWLDDNDVPWKEHVEDVNRIFLTNKDDYEFVREIWPEVKKW